MIRRSRVVAPLIAAAVSAALLLSGCTSSDSLASQYRAGTGQNYIAGDGTVTEYAPANRGPAVSFSGPLGSGGTVSSEQYAGKVLVVNFWYAGCPPCRAEAPDLESLYKKYQPNGVCLVVVIVL